MSLLVFGVGVLSLVCISLENKGKKFSSSEIPGTHFRMMKGLTDHEAACWF